MKIFEHISARILQPSSDGESAESPWSSPESVVAVLHSKRQERWVEFRRRVSTADKSTSALDAEVGGVMGTANLIEGSQVRDSIRFGHIQTQGSESRV